MAGAAFMLGGVVVDSAKQVAGAFFTASTRSIGGATKGAVRGVGGMVKSAGTSVTGLFRPDEEVENAEEPLFGKNGRCRIARLYGMVRAGSNLTPAMSFLSMLPSPRQLLRQ